MIRMMFVTMTLILGHGYGNNCVLDHLQDVDMSEGVDRDGGYDNDDKIMIKLMVILTLRGSQDHIKKILGKQVRQKLQKSQVNWELL